MSETTATKPLTVEEAIVARRSIRKYKAGAVPRRDLDRILELAGRAPSSSNVQPWRFAVVESPELKAKLRAVAFNQAQVEAAPVVIAVYSDIRDTAANLDEIIHPGVPADGRAATKDRLSGMFGRMDEQSLSAFGIGQTFIAVGYLSLAAQSLGYATSIMGGFDGEGVKQVLGLPEKADMVALVALGVADEEGFTAHRHALDRIVTRF